MNRVRAAQLFGVCALVIGFAVWSPTGKFDEFPKYWWDESFTVEIARTFNELGVFDLTVAPNTPSGIAIALNANGFPLSFPLALLFRITGVSVAAARIMMLGWLVLLIAASYALGKRYIGHVHTIAGLILVGTFASFYANGRTATGDIPGLFFFILSLITFTRERFFATGILVALALVTKTSSFHVAPIAVGFALIFTYGRRSFRPLMSYILGGLLVALSWLWILLPSFSWEALAPAIAFFQYPTHKPSLLTLAANDPSLLLNNALILVTILSALLIFAFRKQTSLPRALTLTITFYSVLQILVYLRSPGWSRYLLPVEFLLLLFLPFALQEISRHLAPANIRKHIALTLTILIAITFSLHYQFASDIFPRKSRDESVQIINELLSKYPDSTIGFIDDPVTASLIPGDRKYQYLRIGGDTYGGDISYFTNKMISPTYLNLVPSDLNNDYNELDSPTLDTMLWQKNYSFSPSGE